MQEHPRSIDDKDMINNWTVDIYAKIYKIPKVQYLIYKLKY